MDKKAQTKSEKSNVTQFPLNPPYITDEEKILARQRATTRAAQLAERRDELRLEINAREHIREIYRLLRANWAEQALLQDVSHRNQISENKEKLATHIKMLNKVVPDPKVYDGDVTFMTDDPNTTDSQTQEIRIVAFTNNSDHQQAEPKTLKRINPHGGKTLDALPKEDQTEETIEQAQQETDETVLEWLR